jgi:hypothetical protein
VSSPFSVDELRVLAGLEPVSRDPMPHQVKAFTRSLLGFSEAISQHGVPSPQADDAQDSYRLAAELYAPSLIAALARDLLAGKAA